jgi:hypothetical protein
MADLSWTEPESAANTDYPPVYPYNNIQQTESGHSFELDDTPGRERVRLQHRSGTFTEIHPNGDVVHKILGKGFEIIASNKNVLIKGVCNITINGDSVVHVKGDSYNRVDGNVYQDVKGNIKQTVNGNCEQTVDGDFDVNVSGNMNVNATNLNVNADLNVRGDIGTTQSVSAQGNITAALSVSANKSIETTGYMLAATTINAGVSMFAPTVSDFDSSIEMLRVKIDRHEHIGNRGYGTSPPTGPMEI